MRRGRRPRAGVSTRRTGGGTTAPLWTLGAMRRGELWESTAVPGITHPLAPGGWDVRPRLSDPLRAACPGGTVGPVHTRHHGGVA
jgi:hypothetical protein